MAGGGSKASPATSGREDGSPAPLESESLSDKIARMSMDELNQRKSDIQARLGQIEIKEKQPAPKRKRPAAASPTSLSSQSQAQSGTGLSASKKGGSNILDVNDSDALIPYQPKSVDTHWDFVMKEMMWLGADFGTERKRQMSSAKRMAGSVRQFHKTKEVRRQRALAAAEQKRRRLASRIGRDVRGWWTKIERVVAYKQKLQADEERQVAMNRQLVRLVRQTERYSESLARQQIEDESDSDDDSKFSNESNHDDGGRKSNGEITNGTKQSGGIEHRKRRQKRRRNHVLSVEEALAMPDTTSRRCKYRIRDYSRVELGDEPNELYGQSIATVDDDSDSSYLSASDSDDETTLREAEQEEILERHRRSAALISSIRSKSLDFVADPEELQKLREEANMPVEDVIERFKSESDEQAQISQDSKTDKAAKIEQVSKKVKFANTSDMNGSLKAERGLREQSASTSNGRSSGSFDNGSDADDDGDASDVDDFVAMDTENGDEEFISTETVIDDETTIALEESLPQEMSTEEEIRLLNEENEMTVDELRKRYANLYEQSDTNGEENNKDEELSTPNYSAAAGEQNAQSEIPPHNNSAESTNMDVEDSEEYHPVGVEVDDETTIEAEERMGRDMSYKDELALLDEEKNMSIDELKRRYYGASAAEEDNSESSAPKNATSLLNDNASDEEEHRPQFDKMGDGTVASIKDESKQDLDIEKISKSDDERNVNEMPGVSALLARSDDENDDKEFQPELDAVDDETTIAAEERLGREMSVEDEIAMLQRENEMSVEDLMKLYGGAQEDVDNGDDNHDDDSGSGNPDISDSDTKTARKRKRSDDENSVSSGDSDANEVSALNADPTQASDAHTSEDHTDDGERAMNALEASAERARNTLATRPYLLAPWVKLREYQQIGLNWLVSLQSRRLNGILADEMGLGKTLQTIAMLSYLASFKGIWGPHLVVVPTSVIINWETELKRFCPALKVLCYYGSAKERKELRVGWTQSNWYHVVITSYQLAVQDAFAFKRKRWYYLILDEAQNIKNFQSQRWQTLISFNTQRRLLLTGTPLQNNLMELWSLLHFLMPYVFRSRKEFSYWFSNPMNNMIEGNIDRNEGVINRLHGIIRPFVLRRLKKDVATQMPGKFEHIVKCQLSRRQMGLYEEYLARSSTRMALTKGGNFMGMMNVLMQLRKVCNHPDLFEPRSVITPFTMPIITYRVPQATLFVDEEFEPRPNDPDGDDEEVTPKIRNFLWCGSSGLPSVSAALGHGKIDHMQLSHLEANLPVPIESKTGNSTVDCPPELAVLLEKIYSDRRSAQLTKIEFSNRINHERCQALPFPFAENLLETVKVQCSPFDCKEPVEKRGSGVILTPAQLLAARRGIKQRSEDVDEMVDRFVFCVPKAESGRIEMQTQISPSRSMRPTVTRSLDEMLLEPVEEYCHPFRKAQDRLSSFFPNKKLIQFDSGKLQTLAELLRNLKQGGHRALIFTQMSKMLDILEGFLNFNGHTYLRLDGSTGVDRRQRYMDRFNNDAKIFCFILSTRSGGLGINLVGADSVIFYDSDWNPAMDAQAQDRAHRIGQTRDVHIYRLVTEHTIEENILLKAKQKRNLDIMVMDQGKFDASQLSKKPDDASKSPGNGNSDDLQDVYTKGGLRAILGIGDEDDGEEEIDDDAVKTDDAVDMSKEQMETAMAELEDDDDVKALRGAQKEAAEELKEFEESAEKDADNDGTNTKIDASSPSGQQLKKQKEQGKKATAIVKDEKTEELDMEKEFAAWQSSVGLDASAIAASLTPMERYGLNFREEIDPFYSVFYMNEYNRRIEIAEGEETIDIDEIEREKASEESRAMDEGNLLATRPKPEALIRQRNLYKREKARLRAEKKHRRLTGEDWTRRLDVVSKRPYYYNTDTGEAVWVKPLVLEELEADRLAHEQGWHALPSKVLMHLMRFMLPSPDRMRCAAVCRNWRDAALDIGWVIHVYPVEMGGLSRSAGQREANHYGSISEALSVALPGDTIELSDGHYWVNDDKLPVPFPVRLVGDEHKPANVIVEMSGTIIWQGRAGWIEGVTFRRPKISSGVVPDHNLLVIDDSGRVDTINCVFDNEGSSGAAVVTKGSGGKGEWNGTVVRSGGKDFILNYGDGKIQGRFKGGQKRAPASRRRSKSVGAKTTRSEGNGTESRGNLGEKKSVAGTILSPARSV